MYVHTYINFIERMSAYIYTDSHSYIDFISRKLSYGCSVAIGAQQILLINDITLF